MIPLTLHREQTGFSLLHLIFASEQASQLSLSLSFALFRCCIDSSDGLRCLCHGHSLRYREEVALCGQVLGYASGAGLVIALWL